MFASVCVCVRVCMCVSVEVCVYVCMHECVFASVYGGSRETPKTQGTALCLEEFRRLGRHE